MKPLSWFQRESRWYAFRHGLYWHFPICCIIAYLIRWGASDRPGIHTLHPDRSLKVWVPCWWHHRHPPKDSTRDWVWVSRVAFENGGYIPEGDWPTDSRVPEEAASGDRKAAP